MSGFVGTAARVVGIASLASQLLGLNKTNVTLGGIVFDGAQIEIPERMKWGAHQRVARRVLPGGVVVINPLGADWPPITWKGIFDGPAAMSRTKSLAALSKGGQQLTLTWLDRTFQVMIERFEAEDETAGWIPYEITCQVISDVPPSPPRPTLGQQILSDINQAVGFNVVDAANQAAGVLRTVSTVASVAGALIPGARAFTALAQATGIASAVVGGAIPLAEAGINAIGGVVTGAAGAINWLTAGATSAGNLANATAASGHVDRIDNNLSPLVYSPSTA